MTAAQVSALAPLCVAIPLMAAAFIAPFTKMLPRSFGCVVATLTTLCVFGMACVLTAYTSQHGIVVHWMGGWTPKHMLAIGISFSVDTMNAGLTAFVALLVLAAIVYTWTKFDLVGTLFHSLLLAFLAAMCGYALTGDLFNMFVWFELMTAAAIALTSHKIEEAASIEGAINLAITNAIAGFVVLLGIGFIYARTDALNLAQIGVIVSQRPADSLVIVAFALILTGYFVKGAVAPFHFWLDDAHAVAPTPVCVLFSGIMVQLALYGVARIYWTVFAGVLAPHSESIKALFLGVGAVTAIAGAIMAFAQRHLKRLLAFSTVSHSGMFVAVLGLTGAAGVAAAAMFVLAHGLIKSALFICAGNYLNRFRSLDEQMLGGRGRAAIANSVLFLIGGIALAGLPPFAVSAAKVLYDSAMKDHALFFMAIVMGFASALDAGAVLRAGIHVTFGIGKGQETGASPRWEECECDADNLQRTPLTMLLPAAVLLSIAIWAGLSAPLSHEIQRAAAAFVDRQSYVAAVLQNSPRALPAVAAIHPEPGDIAFNLIVSLAAVIAAFAGLYRDHIPQHLAPIFGPPLRALRNLHSGIFCDYVAYTMIGIAGYGAWLLISMR